MIIANENVTSPLESVRCLDRQQLAIWMFSRLASGLAHAHARGVIHGDIKPANVLIRNDGEPALMDFNLSRFIKDNHEVGAGGTMAYMSPEALGALMRNEDHRDLRSDVYSLGVMFHEVLTGRLPYPRPRSGADIDIEVAITSRNSPVAWTASDSVSLSLQRIVEKCLACDVADRYQSADDFNEDLLLQASSQPLKHAQDSIATRMTKWWHRHRSTTLLILLGVIAIAGLAGVVAISMIWREHTRQTTALASFTQFRQSADRALIKTILSQNRFEDSVLNHLVRSLTDYALIDKQTIQEIVLDPSLSAGDRDFRRAVVFRQLIAAAMTESRRLQLEDHAFKTQRTKTRPSLDRFDTLLNAAQLVIAGNHSNSLRQLKRDRASLAGEKVDGESYSRSAGRLVNSETEVFLAALRACFEKDWERVIVFLDSLPSESVIPSPLQLAIHARAEHANKNFAEAKQKLSQLLHAGYSLPEVYVLRGQCAYRTQQFESAQADWRMASKEDSNQLRSRYELCLSLIRANQFKEAIAEASRGLAFDSTNIPLLLLRSKAHREIGNTEAAQRDFDQANSIESTSVTALDLRARVKADTDLNGAIKDLLLALDMSNQSPVILQRLSLMYCKAGNLSEAIEALQKACVCLPNDEMLHIDLAVLLARNHQFEDSRNHLKIAIELPNAPRVIYQAACVNALLPTQEEHQRGISYLSAAIQRSYGAKSFESDPDLESLRALPGYQAIMRMTRLAKIPDAEDSLNSDDDLLTL
jgi:tetratricopeptide (TPR) repeat protein